MGRNLLKMGRNLFGTKSVKIRRGTKSVWDEICHIRNYSMLYTKLNANRYNLFGDSSFGAVTANMYGT